MHLCPHQALTLTWGSFATRVAHQRLSSCLWNCYERSWLDVQELKCKDLLAPMTQPAIPANLVSIYVAAASNVVKFVGLTPTWAEKCSSPLVKNI